MSLLHILMIAALSTTVALTLGMFTVAPGSVLRWLGFRRDDPETF
jgi:hypothetical protein